MHTRARSPGRGRVVRLRGRSCDRSTVNTWQELQIHAGHRGRGGDRRATGFSAGRAERAEKRVAGLPRGCGGPATGLGAGWLVFGAALGGGVCWGVYFGGG